MVLITCHHIWYRWYCRMWQIPSEYAFGKGKDQADMSSNIMWQVSLDLAHVIWIYNWHRQWLAWHPIIRTVPQSDRTSFKWFYRIKLIYTSYWLCACINPIDRLFNGNLVTFSVISLSVDIARSNAQTNIAVGLTGLAGYLPNILSIAIYLHRNRCNTVVAIWLTIIPKYCCHICRTLDPSLRTSSQGTTEIPNQLSFQILLSQYRAPQMSREFRFGLICKCTPQHHLFVAVAIQSRWPLFVFNISQSLLPLHLHPTKPFNRPLHFIFH